MFKKTITFKDLNGDVKSRDFYFHMSQAEVLDLAAQGDELTARLQRIVAERDMRAILREFREIIKMASGVRSEDGERFIKDELAQSQLLDSPAFDVLLLELCMDSGAASEFVNQLFPQEMREEMLAKIKTQTGENKAVEAKVELPEDDKRPAWLKEGRAPTQAEIKGASLEDLQQAFLHSGK